MNLNDVKLRFFQVSATTKETKERRRSRGEVFTPTWLVEKMAQMPNKKKYKRTLDLCAGYGQMTMGMLNAGLIDNLDNHVFCEIDKKNQEKLRYIFGPDINLVDDYRDLDGNYDLTITNPPFNRNVDLKIVSELEPLCEEMVIVHPSTWAIDLKGKSKLYNRFKSQIEGKVKSLEFFNGNPVFGIGLFVPCMITHIDKSHSGDIRVNYFGEKYAAETLDDVTKFGGYGWSCVVKPFYEKMKKYCSQNGSVWDKNVFEIE